MATRWIRELYGYNPSTDELKCQAKAIAIFLQRCCSFTSPTENVAATGSFFSTEQTGSAGAFTGTAQSSSTIVCGATPPAEGKVFTIDDGWNAAVTFTFTATPTLDTHIDISGSPSAATMSARITTQMNLVRDSGLLDLDAVDGTGTVAVTNHRYGTRGNTTTTTDVVAAGWSFPNMTGGLDGWVLTDTVFGGGTGFQLADIGKLVCVVDATNAVNNGIYRIIRRIDVNSVELDFRGDPNNGEAFTSTSGLTWYMWATSYDLPAGLNTDWWRLASPHATGWAIEMALANGVSEWDVRVAVDGNWGGSKIIGIPEFGYRSTNQVDSGFLCMEVDTTGSYLNLWVNPVTAENNAVNVHNPTGIIVCDITPIEPDRSAIELIALFGNDTGRYQASDGTNVPMQRFSSNLATAQSSNMGGKIWDDVTQQQRLCYLIDPGHSLSADSFTGDEEREVNHRLAARTAGQAPWGVGKNEVFDGSLVIADPDSVDAVAGFEFVGWAKGHLMSRALHRHAGFVSGNTYKPYRKNVQCSQGGGVGNKVHVYGGWVFGWPDGVTFMMNN